MLSLVFDGYESTCETSTVIAAYRDLLVTS